MGADDGYYDDALDDEDPLEDEFDEELEEDGDDFEERYNEDEQLEPESPYYEGDGEPLPPRLSLFPLNDIPPAPENESRSGHHTLGLLTAIFTIALMIVLIQIIIPFIYDLIK